MSHEIAQALGEEFIKSGLQVDVLPLSEIEDLEHYDGVVVGGPMIMGWHRAALRFLKKHRETFQHIPLAVFVTAMSLTQTGETSVGGIPVRRRPESGEIGWRSGPGRLSFRQHFSLRLRKLV